MKRLFVLLLICVASSTGCSSWSSANKTTNSSFAWNSPSTWFKKEYQQPSSLAAIWSPDVLVVQNQGSQRGFGGRIYFYNEKSQAIPVDGDLIVHGYEAIGDAEQRAAAGNKSRADKVFTFGGEDLATHFSPSQLGASYSIWVP